MLIVLPIFLSLITTNSMCCDSSISGKYEIFPSLPPGVELSDNQICADHSRIYRENLDNSTLWAYEMWDSTAKSTVGVLKGLSHNLGNFDQCLGAEAPFSTQYCLVTLRAIVPEIKRNGPLSLDHDPYESVIERIYFNGDESQQPRNIARIGWCTPASCKPEDLRTSLEDYVKNYKTPLIVGNRINFSVSLSSIDCQSYEDQKQFDTLDLSFCILSLILITTAILATIFDGNQSKTNLLTAFSIKRNLPKLMKVDDYDLPILNGVRAFGVLAVILGHRIGFFISGPILNLDRVEAKYRQYSTAFVIRSDLIVDTFFVVSGFLVTYNLLQKINSKMINPGLMILLRYIRLTPVLGFVIFFYATLYNHTGSGPLWKQIVTKESTDCRTNWWTNLLYLNNYINFQNTCIVQSWCLSCDFHYFLIAIGICLVIKRNHKIGLFLMIFISLASIITTFIVTIIYELNAGVLFYPQLFRIFKNDKDFNLVYIKSHTRAAPYFIGMLAGYFYYKSKGAQSISKLQSYSILTLSISAIFASITTSLLYYGPYHRYNKYESALFSALNRPIFALANIGILYVANYGLKWLYNLLTWKLTIPVAKLSYCAFLVHMGVQFYAIGILEGPRIFNFYNIITLYILDLIQSFSIALVLFLIIEEPFKQICTEMLFSRELREKRQ